MYLKELFELWQQEPLLVSTATNGLNAEKDLLLAVALKKPLEGKSYELFIRETHGEDLIPAQRYHQLTEELMNSMGLPEEVFLQKTEEALKGKLLLTYNTSFQYGFLSRALQMPDLNLYDLSVMEQALRKGLRFDEEEITTPGKFFMACSAVYFPLPVNTICKNLKITKQPCPGQLPLERSLDVLQRLYDEAFSQEPQLLPS